MPWRRKQEPTPVFLPEKSQEKPGGLNGVAEESDMTEWLHAHTPTHTHTHAHIKWGSTVRQCGQGRHLCDETWGKWGNDLDGSLSKELCLVERKQRKRLEMTAPSCWMNSEVASMTWAQWVRGQEVREGTGTDRVGLCRSCHEFWLLLWVRWEATLVWNNLS